jgi:7,8-dihydropterin-6-yl-methyl-4-(beta-D-ribofuranosyl)aminobenzene 5'-phosphate synthase
MKTLFTAFILLTATSVLMSFQPHKPVIMNKTSGDLTFTILYDNYTFNYDLESDWGFSCLIEGLDKTILFDTGTKGKVLLSNMKKMGKDPAKVDIVILSHIHQDHTGGMADFLDMNHDVQVFLPVSFPVEFKNMIRKKGAGIKEVSGPMEIMEGVKSTGEMGTAIIEQSLIIQTTKGNVIVTGCAHPWIADIVNKSAEISGRDIFLVMGGFHLLRTSENKVLEIIKEFKDMNIKYAGPTHCSGDRTIEIFKEQYGKNFITLGVGRVLKLSELE